MKQEDGICTSCGKPLNPSSSICPSCGENISSPYISDSGKGKIRPPSSNKLIPRNLLLGGFIVVLIAIIVFLSLNRGGSNQSSLTTNTKPTQFLSPVSPTPSIPSPTPSIPSPTSSILSPTANPTLTSQPASVLPCIVNINTWTGGSQDWVARSGILYNDGTNSASPSDGPTIIAPCQPGTQNYAVEAKIQAINPSNGCFGLVLRGASGQSGWQGYRTGTCGENTSNPNTAYIKAYGDDNDLTHTLFQLGTTTHTYRAEVKDNTIKFFIDGNLIDNAIDNRLLTTETGEEVGLFSTRVQLQVTSFQVMALS